MRKASLYYFFVFLLLSSCSKTFTGGFVKPEDSYNPKTALEAMNSVVDVYRINREKRINDATIYSLAKLSSPSVLNSFNALEKIEGYHVDYVVVNPEFYRNNKKNREEFNAVINAFIWVNDKDDSDVIISFKGTSSAVEVMFDEKFGLVDFYDHRYQKHVGTKVHGGILNAYEQHRGKIIEYLLTKRPKKLLITGHSSGSVEAVYLLFDISLYKVLSKPKITIYTFGSPRFGNKRFMERINNIIIGEKVEWRVFNNTRDPVTHVPPTGTTPNSYAPIPDDVTLRDCFFKLGSDKAFSSHFSEDYLLALKSIYFPKRIPQGTKLLNYCTQKRQNAVYKKFGK